MRFSKKRHICFEGLSIVFQKSIKSYTNYKKNFKPVSDCVTKIRLIKEKIQKYFGVLYEDFAKNLEELNTHLIAPIQHLMHYHMLYKNVVERYEKLKDQADKEGQHKKEIIYYRLLKKCEKMAKKMRDLPNELS